MGKLVGLTGYKGKIAGVGKDTAALYLTAHHAAQFRAIAFADPIRDAMLAIFGWDRSYFEHPKKNEIDPRFNISPRKAMQTLGTEWGRNLINTDLWLILAGARAAPMLGAGFDVLVTDVRFDNEADWIRSEGGVIWHIDRALAAGVGGEEGHKSEAGVAFKKGDYVINNNETMGWYFERLTAYANDLKKQNEEAERLKALKAEIEEQAKAEAEAEKVAAEETVSA